MKILLICSAGISTNLLVAKMKRSASNKGLDCEIESIPEVKCSEFMGKVDIIMLGPQVRFLEKKIRDLAAPFSTPVVPINMTDYGTMNGDNVLTCALECLKTN